MATRFPRTSSKIQQMSAFNIFGWAFGGPELILVVLVVLLLFGGRKIPELMRGLGRGVKEFKDATQNDSEDRNDGKEG